MKLKLKKITGDIGSYVTIRNLAKPLSDKIVALNTIENPAWLTANRFSPFYATQQDIPEFLKFAWEYGNELTCYRGSLDGIELGNVKWKDSRVWKPATFPKRRIELNAEQSKAMDALENTLARNERPFGNLLVIASTSVGKTILQAAIAARLGQKALVICPTDLIMRAWYTDLKFAFGLAKSEIGLLKQSSWKIGKHITLASVQTLGRRKAQWDELNKEFGTIIVDEVQGCSAPRLFEFLSQTPAAYIVGATATTSARHGENHHLKAIFGSPIVQLHTYAKETATSMPISEVKIVETDFKYTYQSDNLDWHDLSMSITGDEERNNLIVRNVKKEWLAGKSILVTTKRREHAELLTEMLKEAGVQNVNQINGETNTNRFYTDKLLELVKSRKVTCLVAVDTAIKTGANIPVLDSLHIVMPPANARDWEQLLGRIRRKAESKTEATVTYYWDKKVPYFVRLYTRIAIPVFKKLQVKGFKDLFVC